MLLNSIDEKELTASDFDKITYISPVIRIVEIDNFKVWQNLIKGEWVNETV
jgi:aspartate carbamoyltransferase regulatory subunit